LRVGVWTKYYNSVFLFAIGHWSLVIGRLSLVIVHRPASHLTSDE